MSCTILDSWDVGCNNASKSTRPSRAGTMPLPSTLPVELIERIADFLFELRPPVPDSTGDAPLCCTKPPWKDVSGFMAASVELHRMGLSRWMRVIDIKETEDWITISQNLNLISEIQCLDNTLLESHNQQILAKLPRLYSATINVHSDVWHDIDNDNQFAYRDIASVLPPSLRRLEITNAHRPDDKIIATVKKYCPQLEELRLGRCTMFNRIPACDFWASFPHDHDAYMADSGTDEYADILGYELSPLKNIRTLRMGLYLVSPNIVLAHRLYHRRGLPAPEVINWQTGISLSDLPVNPLNQQLQHAYPATLDQLVSVLHQHDSEPGKEFDCSQCVEAAAENSRTTEMRATEILRSHIPSLTKVQWMGWLTPGHLGVHSYEFPSKFDVYDN